jgi:hypothetical protein
MPKQIFVRGPTGLVKFEVDHDTTVREFIFSVGSAHGVGLDQCYLTTLGGGASVRGYVGLICDNILSDVLELKLRVRGGIDFQHREGSKIGSGGQLSESQAALERRERLRKLALETIDITKDPYFMRNHLGTFECKLCLTLHKNEGNYLAHTQGKRHQVRVYPSTANIQTS